MCAILLWCFFSLLMMNHGFANRVLSLLRYLNNSSCCCLSHQVCPLKTPLGPQKRWLVPKWSLMVPKGCYCTPFFGPQWSFEGTNLVGRLRYARSLGPSRNVEVGQILRGERGAELWIQNVFCVCVWWCRHIKNGSRRSENVKRIHMFCAFKEKPDELVMMEINECSSSRK